VRSYVVKIQKTEFSVVRPGDKTVKERNVSYSEVRADGGRFYVEERTPTDMLREKAVVIPGDVVSMTWVWDGKILYTYARYSEAYAKAAAIKASKGVIVIYKEPQEKEVQDILRVRRPGTLGEVLGPAERRIDQMLGGTQEVSLREGTESVAGSDCHVVDGVVYRGDGRFKYKVWIDPGHGYNVARAVAWMQRGKYSSYDKVLFRKAEDVWVPMSFETERRREEALNGEEMVRGQVRVTELELNPDHKRLGSFVPRPDDGAEVLIRGMGGQERLGLRWIGGKVVDSKGQVVEWLPEKPQRPQRSQLQLK
jgi:hypothetical protein